MKNRNFRKYLCQVRGWLPGGKMKQQIMEEVCTAVRHYLEENPEANYQEIVARFGTPQQIATSYLDETDTPELLNNLRVKRKIVRIVAGVAATVVAIWLIFVSVSFIISLDEVGGTITSCIDIIDEYTYPEEG